MEMNNNEIKVQQGEDWSLDVLLSSSDQEYIPFIVSSKRENPFFVVTVASTKFEKNLRYVKSWWCSVTNPNRLEAVAIPTFIYTNPVYCGKLDASENLPATPSDTNSPFSAIVANDTANNRNLYQYEDLQQNYDVSVGHYPYRYFYYDYSTGEPKLVEDYECRLRLNFNSDETIKWEGQNYLYQITLVSGPLMSYKLNQIYTQKLNAGLVTPEQWPSTVQEQYLFVKVNWPNELQKDIDIDSPLGKIEQPQVILQPTKLEVYNNLRTLI